LYMTDDGLKLCEIPGVNITKRQHELYSRYESKRNKLNHMNEEISRIDSKVSQQGGDLTEGQARQLNALQQRIDTLISDIAHQEQQLLETFNCQHLSQQLKQSHTAGDDDEDDDYYDQTAYNKAKMEEKRKQQQQQQRQCQAQSSAANDTVNINDLHTIEECKAAQERLAKRRDQLRLQLKDIALQAVNKKSNDGKANDVDDPLDSYMSGITADMSQDRKLIIKQQLRDLQQQHIAIDAIIKQKQGEERVKALQSKQQQHAVHTQNMDMDMDMHHTTHSPHTHEQRQHKSTTDSSHTLSMSEALKLGMQREQERQQRDQQHEKQEQQIVQHGAALPLNHTDNELEDTFLTPSQLSSLGVQSFFDAQRQKYSADSTSKKRVTEDNTLSVHSDSDSDLFHLTATSEFNKVAAGLVTKKSKTTPSSVAHSNHGRYHANNADSRDIHESSLPQYDEYSEADQAAATWKPPKNQTGSGITKLNAKYGY